MNKYLTILSVVLLLLVSGSGWYINSLCQQNNRLDNNQTSLLGELEITKTENGNYKSEIGALKLTASELKEHKEDLVKQVENLNIKLSQVSSVSQNVTEMKVQFKTIIKDSIVYVRDSVSSILDTISLRSVHFNDKWIDLNGFIVNDSLIGSISITDSLIQVVYDERTFFQKLKFWKSSVLKQAITSLNPNCKVIYSEYIEITNKRGKCK